MEIGVPVTAEKLYRGNCSICHGPDGSLNAGGAKDLSISTMSHEERVTIINEGKTSMTPFKDRLSPAQIDALAEFIESLRK